VPYTSVEALKVESDEDRMRVQMQTGDYIAVFMDIADMQAVSYRGMKLLRSLGCPEKTYHIPRLVLSVLEQMLAAALLERQNCYWSNISKSYGGQDANDSVHDVKERNYIELANQPPNSGVQELLFFLCVRSQIIHRQHSSTIGITKMTLGALYKG